MHNCKQISLLLAAITFSIITLAQPRIKLQRVLGGNQDEVFYCMELTSDGGLIAGGYSESNISGDKTENNRGIVNYWIVKLDSNRNKEWDKTLGGLDIDALQAIQQTSDGGYILGGRSSSGISGDKTEPSRGNSDYWVVKLDATGNIEWDKTIGGNINDGLAAIQQTSDGGYILGGSSNSGISGEKTAMGRGTYDYWIVKLNAAGNIEWDKTFGGSKDDLLYITQQTPDGGYILGGYSLSNASGDKTQNSRGSYDYWVVKLDAAGNKVWDRTLGGKDQDILYALDQTSDGGYVLSGSSASDISGEKKENSRGGFDYWIVKLAAAGNVQWSKTIGGNASDDVRSIKQTTDGGYIICGSSISNQSGEKSENSRGYEDYWIVKLNKSREIQWDKTIGGGLTEYADEVREVKKDDYVIGGTSYSGISGDKTVANRGTVHTEDFWVVELKYVKPDASIIAQKQNNIQPAFNLNSSNNALIAYPNPAKDKITIQIKGKAVFTLTNSAGKTIVTKTIYNNGVINVAQLPAGMYYLKNTTTGIISKILIQK